MAHYSKLDATNTVIDVVVISNEDENGSEDNGIAFCKSLFNDPDGVWKKTSYNTIAGINSGEGEPYRLNYGAVGMIYNEELDGFVGERNVPDEWVSWTLSPTSGTYEPPTPYPTDGYLADDVEATPENIQALPSYNWEEETLSWVLAGTLSSEDSDPIPSSTP